MTSDFLQENYQCFEFKKQPTTSLTLSKAQMQYNNIQDQIMNSFIIGVCLEKSFAKTKKDFTDILQIMARIRFMMENSFYDEVDILSIYNKVVISGHNIQTLYEQVQQQYEIQQETQRYYFPQQQQQFQKQQNIKEQIRVEERHSKQIEQQQSEDTQNSNNITESQQQVFINSLVENINNEQSNQKDQNSQDKNIIEEESQIINNKSIKQIECKICWENSSLNEVKILSCNHIFHFTCLNQSCITQIKQKILPICPSKECKLPIDESDLLQLLDDINLDEFQQLSLQKFIDNNSEEFSCCLTSGCNYKFNIGDTSYFECPQCNKMYCLKCKVEYHIGYSCEEFNQQIQDNKELAQDDQFINFALLSKFKQCPQCKFWVEKNNGCNHMTCRCKFEFCYVCGGVYKQCSH